MFFLGFFIGLKWLNFQNCVKRLCLYVCVLRGDILGPFYWLRQGAQFFH